MAKIGQRIRTQLRLIIQLLSTALGNGYLMGFMQGKLYTGPLKRLCLPGLNCYSCPGALGACP
ncbi:MAG: 4Fe-4S binding protein, partial [Clostridia bacterium]